MTERTLIIIKPDAVQRQLMGKILTRFEEKGLKVVAAKFMHISQELARKHYAVHEGKPFFEGVVRYLSSAPVLVLVLEAEGVIAMSRKLMGETFGNEATPGTIRGDFGACRGYNLNSRIRNGFVLQTRRNRRLQTRRRRLALRQQRLTP
jgi:nucleoside-diphosphate kinase